MGFIIITPQLNGAEKNWNAVTKKRKKMSFDVGVPVVAQWLTSLTRNHEVAGSIPGFAQWLKDLVLL